MKLSFKALALFPVLFSLFFVFNNYYGNYYDSSSDGSEIKEIYNNSIPQDVKELMRIYRLENGNVFGAKTLRVPILMYHYVEYVKDKGDTTRISLNIPPYIFEEQIKTLISANYTFITNEELADAISGKSKLPQNPILLTFDDGYDDFYTDVFPILKKYNIKATNYVISGFLNRNNHLTDSETREIIDSKLVEIGAHTVHHSWLKGKDIKYSSQEVLDSKKELEEKFKIKVVSFAYPFGAFDKDAIEAVKKSGFKSAVSTVPGADQSLENEFFLLRLRPGARTGDSLLTWLKQKEFAAF